MCMGLPFDYPSVVNLTTEVKNATVVVKSTTTEIGECYG